MLHTLTWIDLLNTLWIYVQALPVCWQGWDGACWVRLGCHWPAHCMWYLPYHQA